MISTVASTGGFFSEAVYTRDMKSRGNQMVSTRVVNRNPPTPYLMMMDLHFSISIATAVTNHFDIILLIGG